MHRNAIPRRWSEGARTRTPSRAKPDPMPNDREAAYRAAIAFLVSTDTLLARLPPGRRRLGQRLRRRAVALVVRVARGMQASPLPLERWMPAARRSSRECVAMLEALALACPSVTGDLERGRSRLAEVVARLFLVRIVR